jgi:acyclic sesquiterpene synthase
MVSWSNSLSLSVFFDGFYRWDEHHKVEFYSEQVEIVFSAIYTSVNELGEKASLLQDRDVTKHLVEIVSPKCNFVWQSFFFLSFWY